jgi:hypothetical protein
MMVAMVFAANPVDVRSATNCPAAEDVVERLLPLLPATVGNDDGQDVARIDVGEIQAGGAMELHLLLVRADATVIGERRLLMQGTCQDMADAVATVIATWETKPLSGAAPEAPPASETHAAIAPMRVESMQPTPLPNHPIQIIVSAGAGVALVGGVAGTSGIDVQFGRTSSHWQLRVGMMGETARQINLWPGQVDWQRTTAAAGLSWRILDSSWLLALDAGPVVGWATLAGSGFSPSRQQRSFDYGAAAGLRAGRSFGRFALWAEWRTNVWTQVQRATLTGSDSSANLPQVDISVGLGLSLVLFR